MRLCVLASVRMWVSLCVHGCLTKACEDYLISRFLHSKFCCSQLFPLLSSEVAFCVCCWMRSPLPGRPSGSVRLHAVLWFHSAFPPVTSLACLLILCGCGELQKYCSSSAARVTVTGIDQSKVLVWKHYPSLTWPRIPNTSLSVSLPRSLGSWMFTDLSSDTAPETWQRGFSFQPLQMSSLNSVSLL